MLVINTKNGNVTKVKLQKSKVSQKEKERLDKIISTLEIQKNELYLLLQTNKK